jgi:hypothetical protein
MKKLFEHPATFPVITTLLFVLSLFLGVMAVADDPPGAKTGDASGVASWPPPFFAKAVLALAFLALAAWFMHAFTQADDPSQDEKCLADQRASMFRFAYTFSLFSFALLVLPFTAMLRTNESPPDAGPIRLLRACVQVQPAARAASEPATRGPIDICPAKPPEGAVSYPWLVAVGGVVAQECGRGDFHCSAQSAAQAASRAAAAASAAKPAAAAGASAPLAGEPFTPPLYSVMGGFVVPFYVVVFAFVGGVVNLTRRVPEYQKRSSCHFTGTATESVVTLLEAREFVVFQIMQLLTAPFVAMVAYYALEPKSTASAAGLAFVSGFATESVLLLIRGMVNGLKPETTTKTAAASAAATATLHVVVKHGGANVAAKVEVRKLPNQTPALKEKATTTGEAEFAALTPGTVWVVATLAGPPVQTSAPQKVNLVSGQTEFVEIVL